MGFDNDCILYYRDISKQYFCAVCRTLVYPNEAMQAPCTHLYCKMCLAYVVSTTNACPYDGCRVTEADSKPLLESNVMMAATIGKIPVRCLYYRTGCTWKGSLSDCTIHFPNCAFGDSTVACGNCGILMKHRQVHEHGQNCSGVQSQVQQPSGVSESTSAGTAAGAMVAVSAISGPNHTATAVAAGDSASLVSNQVTNQLANSVTQPPVAQAAMPTPEQYYQPQMQLDQQYYQLYQGYEPYQYSYQYPQVAQQYQPQQTQGHLQFQPIVQTQQQVPPQVPPQVQPFVQLQGQALPLVQANGQAQPQMQTYGQAQPNAQAHFQTHTQAMELGQAPMPHALSYNQAQPLLQAQPYTQPQLVPEQQQLQLPQLGHTHPQMQPYPQFQTHEYPHPQPQVHSLPHTQPNLQPFVHPPQQPLLHSAQLLTPNAVSGYQSYPQPQFGAVPPTHVAGAQWQVQYPDQMQGQFPLQAPQMPPPQAYSDVRSQQQSATLFAQGHPSAQHPHMQAQQPEYQFQQRPGMQSAQQVAPQEYGQQQSSPAQRPLMQHSHSMIGQVRQPQLNKNYPVETDNEALTARQHAAQSQRVSSAEKSHNRMIEKTVHNRLNASKKAKHTNDMPIISSEGSREAPDTAMISSEGNMDGVVKLKAQNNLMVNTDGNEGENFLGSNKQMDDVETKVDKQVHEVKPREKGDPREGVSKTPCDAIKSGEKDPVDGFKSGSKEPVDGFKKAEVKYTPRHNPPSSTSRKSLLESQVHDENPSGVSGPADINPRQSNLPPHQTTQPQNHSNSPQFEERQAHPIGPTEHNSFRPGLHGNQPRAMKFDDPSAFDPNPAHRTSSRMPDNRVMPFPEEQFKSIPRTEFEDNSTRFPRPPHLNYGPSSNYGTEFPSSGPLDGNNMPRSFEQDPAVGMDVTGFGPSRLLPPSHPKDAGEWAHASTNDNMGRTKFSRRNFSRPCFGRRGDYPTHKSRFPVPPRVVTAFGRPGEPSWIAPLGNFQPHVPFHDSFAGENVGHPLQGEPGFGNGYDFQHAHDGGFYPREMNSVGNLRLQKPGSIMCKLCKVECGSVEGLDLHSQSKEHQQMARDIVLSIKQQSNKKQKVFKDEASAGIGRDAGGPKKPEF